MSDKNYSIIKSTGVRMDKLAEETVVQLIKNDTLLPTDSISDDGVTWHKLADVVEIGGKKYNDIIKKQNSLFGNLGDMTVDPNAVKNFCIAFICLIFALTFIAALGG